MFFRKKKDDAKRQAEEAAKKAHEEAVLKDLQGKFDDVDRTEDAGEKILKIEKLQEAIEAAQRKVRMEQGAIEELHGYSAAGAGLSGILGGGLIAVGVGVAGAGLPAAVFISALTGGLAIPVALGLGGAYIITKQGEAKEKKIAEAPYAMTLNAHHVKAAQMLDQAINHSSLEAIAASPHREHLTKKYGSLRKRFEEAAKKKEAEKGNDIQPDAPKPPRAPTT